MDAERKHEIEAEEAARYAARKRLEAAHRQQHFWRPFGFSVLVVICYVMAWAYGLPVPFP
jgi:predicted transcriptional regulator